MITLLVFLLTVFLQMDGEPAAITRAVQQTPGFATMEACAAEGIQAAMTPGVVFWTCTDGGASVDALVADWQHASTGETPLFERQVGCATAYSAMDFAPAYTLTVCPSP